MKKLILIILLFIVGVFFSLYSHFPLANLVLDLFTFSTNNKIVYIGKGIIIPSSFFLISFSTSFTILFYDFFSKKDSKTITLLYSSLIFFLSIVILSYTKANLDLFSCTTCDDGILKYRHYNTGYNLILSIASISSLTTFLYLLKEKKSRTKTKPS